MQHRLIVGIALCSGVMLFAPAAWADPPPAPDQAVVGALVKQLDDQGFAARQDADRKLRALGIGVVPQLRHALQNRLPLEVSRRLELIIDELANLRWHDDVEEAMREAAKTGKPILILSTLGKPDSGALGARALLARTFDDPELVDFLKKNFVTVWHDHLPRTWPEASFLFGSVSVPEFTAEQVQSYDEGRGAEIVYSYFCTADGKARYCLRGFWQKDRYLAEARFAAKMLAESKDVPLELRREFQRSLLTQRGGELCRERQGFGQEDARRFELLEHSISYSGRLLDQPFLPVLEGLTQEVKKHATFG
jgi:hypothetical protein